MASTVERPIFLFFKKISCPPCNSFYEQVYFSADKKQERLVNDKDLKDTAEFRIVEFGLDPVKRVTKSIESSYPDMIKKIKYAPFFWFHPSGQRSKGIEYAGKRDFASVKKWIQDNAKKFLEEDVTEHKDEINEEESCDIKCTKEEDKKKYAEWCATSKCRKPVRGPTSGIDKGIPGPSGATQFRGKK